MLTVIITANKLNDRSCKWLFNRNDTTEVWNFNESIYIKEFSLCIKSAVKQDIGIVFITATEFSFYY